MPQVNPHDINACYNVLELFGITARVHVRELCIGESGGLLFGQFHFNGTGENAGAFAINFRDGLASASVMGRSYNTTVPAVSINRKEGS